MGSPLSSGCAQPIRIVVPLRLSTTGCAGAHGAPGAVDKYLREANERSAAVPRV